MDAKGLPKSRNATDLQCCALGAQVSPDARTAPLIRSLRLGDWYARKVVGCLVTTIARSVSVICTWPNEVCDVVFVFPKYLNHFSHSNGRRSIALSAIRYINICIIPRLGRRKAMSQDHESLSGISQAAWLAAMRDSSASSEWPGGC